MDESEAVTRADGPKVTVREGYMKRRARVEFDGEYDGVWVECWVNCPKRLVNGIASDDTARSDAAMSQFILDHNLQYPVDQERPEDADDDWAPGFRSGHAMPQPITAEAVGYIPVDLYRRIVELGMDALQKAAKVTKRG